jgi:hypothetical protein
MSKQKRFDEHIGIWSSEAKYSSISTCFMQAWKTNFIMRYIATRLSHHKKGEEIEIPKPIYMKKN